jgi:hypothetical protein
MDELYEPYVKQFESSKYWTDLSNTDGEKSNRLQMLTGLFAVSLFLLGITAVMKIKNLVAYLVIFSIVLWLLGIIVLISIPTIFS